MARVATPAQVVEQVVPADAMEYAREAMRRKAKALVGYCPHRPHPKQAEFLALTCEEAFYGGAAGGGKSESLLMAALQNVHVPGYAALILRRTFADLALPGAIMARAAEWLTGTDAVWRSQDKTWTFPSGATLTFGYCDNEGDYRRYQGAELQFLGVDELPQWPENWYRYLLSRLRKLVDSPVPVMARSTGNPGGIGHYWVKKRFVDAETRVGAFVPATLADNPSLDAAEYRKMLSRLDAMTRKQLEEGLWVADACGLVYAYDAGRNAAERLPVLTEHVVAVDFGVTDDCAVSVLGWAEHEPTVYVVESKRYADMIPTAMAEVVTAYVKRFVPMRVVGDVGGLGKGFAEEARRRFHIPIVPAQKRDKRGYQSLLNGALERGELKVYGPACAELVKEWGELPWNKDRTAEHTGFDNHCADATLYGWRECMAFAEEKEEAPVVRTVQDGIAEWAREAFNRRSAQVERENAGESGLPEYGEMGWEA